jgi:hypothetical protein
MTNAEIKVRRNHLLWLLDGWLKDISNEGEPVCDLPFSGDAVNYAYQAGAYKARAEINARRLQTIRDLIAKEFDVQSRVKRI